MKKLSFFLILSVLFAVKGFSQMSLKLRFPKCELVNKSALSASKDNQLFLITSKEEFEKYFKITDDFNLNFDGNVVLAAILGSDNGDKLIEMDAASFIPESRRLLVRYDYTDKKDDTNAGKFCVAVIQRMDFKRIKFLKGTAYSIRQNYRD